MAHMAWGAWLVVALVLPVIAQNRSLELRVAKALGSKARARSTVEGEMTTSSPDGVFVGERCAKWKAPLRKVCLVFRPKRQFGALDFGLRLAWNTDIFCESLL